MRKSSDVIGTPIVLPQEQRGERIIDWILDLSANRLLGFVVTRGGWSGGARILLWENIRQLSDQAVVSASVSPIIEIAKIMRVKQVLERRQPLIGLDVITRNGKLLGKVVDFYFDEEDGTLIGLATALQTALDNGKATYAYVPILEPLSITNGFIVASPAMLKASHSMDTLS